MLRLLTGWWDGVELWLTQLAFPMQVVLVVAVVGPACWGAAAMIDMVVERSVAARLAATARRRETPPAPQDPPPDPATPPPAGPAPTVAADPVAGRGR